MIRLLYNLILFLALPGIVAYHWYRSKSRGRRSALSERFGVIPQEDLAVLRGERVILVHAVSVGETIASFPLLKGLRSRYPGHKLVLTNVTETGRAVALKSNLADRCLYLPFDYLFAVRSLLRQVNPELIVLMETELWPNFIRAAAELEIPVLLANGRISDRSFGRYLRLAWFFGPVLRQLSGLGMQTAVDAERIAAIGARPETVRVTGNLKYDIPLQHPSAEELGALKRRYGIPAQGFVFTVASTHEGEDEPALDAYQRLLAKDAGSFLILAPRHPERAAAVAELVARRGLSCTLRSRLSESPAELAPGSVLLLDTVGELARLYSVSDLVFVGGSLVPTGGHNPLEPAACGVAVLFGPHMENFREIASFFLDAGAGLQVPDAAGLAAEVLRLAGDHAARRAIGEKGRALLEECSGATGRTLDLAAALLAHAPGTAAPGGRR
ncbi:3-deoxy-D-manno-octulosonic acid transferase [Geomonas limicola]|uniref:3-deoxy-D-manno-octulosonic acid transferase n=1 Tax=Geomonas limicola TaxID=2740186 RepID=A0A6V8NDJ8_9BACT|nr:3-deoxy-D-manno-octulosonic acid transferase [Geomonas limicola]GFO70718.1 3-deoxy-D-manno-octulosonic acid transferase [Geomonas limicola]